MRTRCTEAEIEAAFAARFGGVISAVRRHGSGHIHDTFVLDWHSGGASVRLLAQRFNTDVFGDPEAVMRNILRVTDHVRAKLEAAGARDVARRVLRVLPAPDGSLYFQAASALPASAAETYRAFEFIDGTEAFEVVARSDQPRAAGAAFGDFVASLEDLPGGPLAETIPGFHDTVARLAALRAALADDPLGRGSQLQTEFARIEANAELAAYSEAARARGELSLQTVHNDAKLSNLLFDARTHEALCVVDLDTVMPGFALYDFGDLVRTTACLIAEDASDVRSIDVRMDYVEQLARGYLEAQSRTLRDAECEALAIGARLICLELSMRFLTDHVLGDEYFAIARPGQNLARARVQLALVDELERRHAEVRECVFRAWKS
jgi:Ser/Thr protein kinase RdoA (MazF antagonist)